jgi:hypothetical protein
MMARASLLLVPLLVMGAGACIQRGYPLGSSGSVDVRPDVAAALFAAERLDKDGKPILPRQSPSETGVTLSLTEGSQPAYGAWVDVQVSPPEALELVSDPAEKLPTCKANGGVFQCMATDQGFARFVARSPASWSGTAKLQVIWGGNQPKEVPITVLPAGLPQDATDFRLIVGGLGGNERVLATYATLQCTAGPVPDDLGSKWRPGMIRARQAYVIASPPPSQPDALSNAPVIVESQSADAAVATKADCSDRGPRLRTLFTTSGQTDPFYLCFSDNGGTIHFSVGSGVKTIDPQPEIVADPEPRLLRVRTLDTQVEVGYYPLDLFEISAYNADRVRIAMPVDVGIDDATVLGITVASLSLTGEDAPATVVQALPIKVGTTTLHASPRLLDTPLCTSEPVTVSTVATP